MSQNILSKKDAPRSINNTEKQLSDNDFIVSKTDTKGRIIYCNEIFTQMAGYPANVLIGANHNLIRHPDMPAIAFKHAWNLITQKKEFFGFVKNLSADGSYYWVFTCISPDLDPLGNIISYTSVRRKPSRSAIEKITPIYKLLCESEKSGGMEASGRVLNEYLTENRTSYDKFVINLQNNL